MGGKQGRKKQIKPMPEFPVPYSAKTSLEVFFFLNFFMEPYVEIPSAFLLMP